MNLSMISPLVVGRDEEIARLEDALLDAARGDGRFVVVLGEAGIGKSRLTSEAETRAGRLGFTVMHGACSEAELALPYLPLIEAIGNYIAMHDTTRLLEQLGGVRTELARLFPQLGDGEALRQDGDAAQAKLRLFESIVSLLAVPATETGLLLVVEDIHWADASTRELLDYLTRRLLGLRAMVLVTYRSDELHRKHPLVPTIQSWRRTGVAEVIELREMSESDMARMMTSILDTTDIAPELRENMHRRSEGNPFVLEEMLREAIDRGDIYRTTSRWEYKDLENVRLPDQIKDTILLRLSRLDETDVLVLQTAAILGYTFDYSALKAVANTNEPEVQSAIAAGIGNQLVVEAGVPGRYRFRHALTQEAIYDDVVLPRRQDIHSRAADALTADPNSNPVDRAVHLLGAARFKEAVPVCLEAAENAERAHAYGEAVTLYERALPHCSNDLERAQVLCRMGRALAIDGRAATAETCLREGIALFERLDEPLLAARFRLILGRAVWELSLPALAAEEYDKALKALESGGPSSDLALAYMRVSGLHLFQLEIEPALEAARKSVTTAEAAGDEITRIWALGFLALALMDNGNIDEGLSAIQQSYDDAMANGVPHIAHNAAFNDLWNRVHCMIPGAEDAFERLKRASEWGDWGRSSVLMCSMYLMRMRGEIEQWVETGRHSVDRFERLQNDKFNWRANLLLAESLLEHGDVDAARRVLPEIDTRVEVQDIVYDSPARIRIYIATGESKLLELAALSILEAGPRLSTYRPTLALGVEAFVHLGDLDRAEEVLEVAERHPFVAAEAALRQVHGRLALARGDAAAATEALGRAAEGYLQSGYVLDELRTHVLAASALSATGDRNGAQATLLAAAERAAAIGARRVLEEVFGVGRTEGLSLDVTAPAEASGGEVATGERLVTVLFADVRGYTELSSRRSPNEMVEMVTSLQRWATREVDRQLGIVDKFAGDAVMATFNISGNQVDHCRHALEAAIALRDKAGIAGIPLGTGIAVGPAVVGRLARDANLSVIGETTNLAARLQSASGAGEIVLSEEAHRRVRDWLLSRDISVEEDVVSVKGFGDPVRIFRIPGRPDAQAPL